MARAISVSDRPVGAAAHAAAAARCRRIDRWIRLELARHPPRAKSLVVTVWGDAIAPHLGAVWLGSLIRLMAPFGLNERLVRTSVYRLTREGWLVPRQNGRRSLYRLTTAGAERFEHAYRRIYAPPTVAWDGTWEIVLALDGLTSPQRRHVRRELGWEGFGALGSGLFARPLAGRSPTDLESLLAALGLARKLVVLQGRDVPQTSAQLRSWVLNCWDLRGIAAEYRAFLARFRGVIEEFPSPTAADPQQAFVVRTLLIHAFRRVTLHDPGLPRQLWPPRWPSLQAYALCRDFYRRTQPAAEHYLSATLQVQNERLPRAAPYFYQRFGGLRDLQPSG
jgi:phenylacetic acid degradation operon negative regulatory protein